jgi:DNA-binding IclR family transcriptional regulator
MLGPSLVDLAAAYLRQDDPVQRFHAFVATQRVIAAETVQLAVLSGADVLYLAHHNGAQPIALTSGVGRRLPVSCTSMGKAILSSLDDAKVKELVQDPLPQLTPRSHSTVASLQQDLTMTRERGYAVDDEEAALGVVCVGVAVPRRQGDPAYAVSATVFKPRFTPDFEGEVVSDLTTLARVLASS